MAHANYITASLSEHSGRIEIGPYDPARWDGQGGHVFGESVDVTVSFGEEGMEATVQIGGIMSHDAETAQRRIDAYQQGADLCRWIEDRFADGDDWPTVARALLELLPLGVPTTFGFRYGR